jgi:hypothetical protein
MKHLKNVKRNMELQIKKIIHSDINIVIEQTNQDII